MYKYSVPEILSQFEEQNVQIITSLPLITHFYSSFYHNLKNKNVQLMEVMTI